MSDKNELPEGWVRVRLQGITLPSHNCNPKKERSGTFQYVDIESLDNSRQIISEPKTLPVDEAPSRARMLMRSGDILFSLVRPYLKNIAIVPEELDMEIASTAYCVVRPSEAVDSKFLFHQVTQDSFINSIPTYGSSPPAARDNEFLDMEVLLAPLPEQHRIVAKIEELFSDLDAGVAALERAKANLKRYRTAVLKEAVEGRLTEEWRAEQPALEPASVLLSRILEERRARWEAEQLAAFEAKGKTPPKDWQGKYKEPAAPDVESLPELPEGWTVASLDQISLRITSGSRDWTKYYHRGLGTFIMAQNVRPGKLDLSFRQAVDPPVGDRDRMRSQVCKDDVLVTIVGANTGDVCRVDFELHEHYVCQSVALIRPVLPEASPFATLYLVSPEDGQRQFRRYIYGAGRPHLSFDQLKMTAIALPPLAEQVAIVAEVERLFSILEEAERSIEFNIARSNLLRQSILKRAFEGKLVPQDPNDEPASVLLERIGAERENDTKNGAERKEKKKGELF